MPNPDPAFPIESLRRDTPGVENVIHFNNAGSSLPPQIVVDTTIGHLQREAEIGGYEAANEAGARLDSVYDSIAAFIGGRPDQVAVIENATRAWDMAVYGYPFKVGDRVLTARAEYVSNMLALLQLQQRHGIEIVLIDDDEHGQIDLTMLERELAAGATMVSLTHVPTSGGLINPATEVGALCAAYDTFYVLDACQSVGQVPIDVGEIGCDVLSTTGRKYLRGPRGTGWLYTSDRALERIEPPFLDLHAADWVTERTYEIRADAKRFENWETNFAGKLGLGAAVDYALALDMDAASARTVRLGELLREQLQTVPGLRVHDKGAPSGAGGSGGRGGIVTFDVSGFDSDALKQALSDRSINTTSSGAARAHFDLGARNLPTLIRASVHYYNTEDEIDAFVAAVADLTPS